MFDAAGVGSNDQQVIVTKFAQLLSTATAGGDDVWPGAADQHCFGTLAARHEHGTQGGGFCAPALGVGCVLDVAAGMHATLVVQHGSAHCIVGVGRICFAARGQRGSQQALKVAGSKFLHGVAFFGEAFAIV